MEIDVSIVIPTKNGAATLKPCLDSIYSQNGNYRFEIIAVDSESRDNTIEILKKYGCIIKSIRASEFRHGYARNLGADCSKGRFIVFLNQDALPADRYWLKELITPLSEEYTVATYSRQVPHEGTPLAEKLFLGKTYPSTPRVLTEHDLSRRSAMNIVFLSTVSCAIRRDLYARYRFSDTIIMGEDQELAVRLLRDGYGIKYVSSSIVTHSHSYSLLDVFKRYFDCGWCLTYNEELSSVKTETSLKEVLLLFSEVSRNCYKYGIGCYCFSVVYTLMKILGFSLGLKSNFLPYFIRNKMSYTMSKIKSR